MRLVWSCHGYFDSTMPCQNSTYNGLTKLSGYVAYLLPDTTISTKGKVYEKGLILKAKQHLKAEKLEEELAEGKKPEVMDEPDSEDEDKYADRADMPGQKFDTKRRTTVRNLRIREDTAKYLHNLDPNSAYYDPKTRSMRDNPFKEQDGIANK
ncbi:hypothetical protein ACROYT_G004968 [Oculina patagonica]